MGGGHLRSLELGAPASPGAGGQISLGLSELTCKTWEMIKSHFRAKGPSGKHWERQVVGTMAGRQGLQLVELLGQGHGGHSQELRCKVGRLQF